MTETKSAVMYVPFPTLPFIAPFVAKDMGFMQDLGVDMTLKIGIQEGVRAVLSGTPSFALLIFPFFKHGAQESEFRSVCGLTQGPIHRLVTKPEIRQVGEMKGKTLMVNSFGGTSHLEMISVLQAAGLDSRKDLKLVEAGPTLEVGQVEALRKGEVDGIASSAPYFRICENEGYNVLGATNEKWASSGVITSPELILRDPELVGKVVQGMVRSTEFARSNKEKTVEIASKNITFEAESDLLGVSYDLMRDGWTYELEEDALKNFFDLWCQVTGHRKVDVKAFIEPKFLNSALKRGPA